MKQGLLEIVRQPPLSQEQIALRRDNVRLHMLAESDHLLCDDFQEITRRDLEILFAAYDEQFYAGHLRRFFAHNRNRLTFRLSHRMTNAGGTTTYRKELSRRKSVSRQAEIAISSTLLFNTFRQGRSMKATSSRPEPVARVGGLPVAHRLDALQRIFEHELVHLTELCLWDTSSCARKRFKSIVLSQFGHIESNHQLVTPSERAKEEHDITVGDRVEFRFEKKTICGIVNRINRRATVLVRSSQGRLFSNQQRYQKFYVPLQALSKCE